jgi:hypothetical protein
MKHSLYFLILISSSLSAAEVGFNAIGYVTNIPNNSQSVLFSRNRFI